MYFLAIGLWTLFFFKYIYFNFTILYWFCHTLTWIRHRCTWLPNPEPPSHHPSHIISLVHPSAPAPSILYPVSNLDWQFISYMIVYMFQCCSLKSPHPLPLPQSFWKKYLFFIYWVVWVFATVQVFSRWAEQRPWCMGFQLQRVGSRACGLSSCGAWA